MRWPTLSIRATVFAAIVVGVVLPAVVVIAIDAARTRRAQEPVIERTRAAIVVLANATITEPAWTLSAPGLNAAVTRILDEPSVCRVEVLDLQPTVAPIARGRTDCADAPLTVRESVVLHEGQTIARLRLGFDDSEIDRLLAERLRGTIALVAAQVLLGIAVLAGVISLRLLRPIDVLKRQAGGLAARDPLPPHAWPRRDELGQLGQHLNTVHGQINGLIRELEEKNAELRRMAMQDALTGLPNRALLRELFEHEAAAARREGTTLALMFVDLDQFKAINDTHGHAAGDDLLIGVGRTLRETVRGSDVVCRMGGDEFLILLPRVAGIDEAVATAERLLAALDRPHTLVRAAEPVQVRVRASIGIACFPQDGADFDALARAADVAMYRSKAAGRGRHSLYHADYDSELRARLEQERELLEAVAREEFVLHVQPVIDASNGRVQGHEALLRWQHPRRGLLAPGEFLATAEQTGIIVGIGRWVVEAGCRQIAAWKAAGAPACSLAVNVSALQLRDPSFTQTVLAAMQAHGIGPGELVIELTESMLLADGDAGLETLATLRGHGVGLSVDDFGTGYSSLSYLKRVRPDTVKIDRSFVRDLPDDADDRALVQAVLGIARALGIGVIAEGVETPAQRDWLLAEGCALQQGWLWARPGPPA
jgi:diguanylate cyclase (GGDEF)-like protein